MATVLESVAGTPQGTDYTQDLSWVESVRALDEHVQTRLLGESDRMREGDERQQRLARACYAALQSRLDPNSERDLERIRWAALLTTPPPLIFEPLVRRVAASYLDEALRMRAMVSLGALADTRGHFADAARWYRIAWTESTGRGSWAEIASTVNLARLYRRQCRSFETLVVARRAEEVTVGADSAWGRTLALLHRDGALFDLGDIDRAWKALEATKEAASVLTGRHRALADASLHGHRAALLAAEGHVEEALRQIDIEAELLGDPENDDDARGRYIGRAALYRRLGRVEEAEELLNEARRISRGLDARQLEAREQLFLAAHDAGDPDTARGRAHELLDAVLDCRSESVGPAWRLEFCLRIAGAARARLDDPVLVERAYAEAANAAIERVGQLQRVVGEQPLFGDAHAEDLAVFVDHRRLLVEEHPDFAAALAPAYSRAVERGDPSGAVRLVRQDRLCICAWCERVRDPDGSWLPIRELMPESSEFPLTHGICTVCRARVTPARRTRPR